MNISSLKELKELLYESKFKSKGGESEVMYHVSPHENIADFHPFSHFGTSNAARAVAFDRKTRMKVQPKHTYAVRLKLGNVAHIPQDSGSHHPTIILKDLHDNKQLPKMSNQEYENHQKHFYYTNNIPVSEKQKYLSDVLRKHDIHSVSYTNETEDAGKRSYMITHPNQVRILHRGSKINVQRGEKSYAPSSSISSTSPSSKSSSSPSIFSKLKNILSRKKQQKPVSLQKSVSLRGSPNVT